MQKGGYYVNKRIIKADKAKGVLKEALLLIPNMLKLLYRLADDENIPGREKALLIGAAAYVISPWDFLPDVIPFLGQVDDLLLVALVLKRFMNIVGEKRLLEYWDGNDNLLLTINDILDLAEYALPAGVYQKIVKKASMPADETVDVEYDIREEKS